MNNASTEAQKHTSRENISFSSNMVVGDVEDSCSGETNQRDKDIIEHLHGEPPKKKRKAWSHMERLVLAGCAYDELFRNPSFNKDSWISIEKNVEKFHDFLKIDSEKRGTPAMQRYFKELKKENIKRGCTLFRELYGEWTQVKSKSSTKQKKVQYEPVVNNFSEPIFPEVPENMKFDS
eukprot:snap_masked-scaffold_11-processed-gene-12.45-mRNA-1 protein AED:1.00 eAED:1.00 QI:0/-1/0/0/-1/1/1/0/177